MIRWIAFTVLGLAATAFAQPVIHVSAAISLREALEKTAVEFKSAEGCEIKFNFGASGVLAAQVEQGAEVDIFIGASHRHVDQLIQKGTVEKESKTVIARNELVLVTPAASTQIASFQDLAADTTGKVAIGEPRTVPAGEYAMQTFDGLTLSTAVAPKLIFGATVRQVLDYVVRGEVDAGVVYRTDAIVAGAAVRVAAVADESWHTPIEYPSVIVGSSQSKELSRKYITFLQSEAGQEILCKRGFATTRPTTHPATQPSTQATSPEPSTATPTTAPVTVPVSESPAP
ncbi:MAG: molybdate ABC transporter substrate-binding protein [Burkholderiales bacterium]|nr:molybdate ABC transporter substrate-binding protein [Phycisphaerae bacterium]